MTYLARLTHKAGRQLMLLYRGEQILARFPGPVTVKPVLTRSVGSFITVSMLIVVACLWGIWHGWEDSGSSTRVLMFCAAVFACSGAASFVMLRTNSMTLDSDGFEVVIGLRKKKKRYRWTDVSAFERQYFFRGNYVVAFDAEKGGGVLAVVDRALGLRNSNLYEDYGLGEEQFAELLNRWRDRALTNREVSKGDSGGDIKLE
jgi:hypothetical protein